MTEPDRWLFRPRLAPGLEKTSFSSYHRATLKEVEDVPNPFAIQTSTQSGISIITLEGFVDAHTAPQFEQAVQAETEAGRCRIIVDCSKLNYISSALKSAASRRRSDIPLKFSAFRIYTICSKMSRPLSPSTIRGTSGKLSNEKRSNRN
jgi:anti-anti-sigma factor